MVTRLGKAASALRDMKQRFAPVAWPNFEKRNGLPRSYPYARHKRGRSSAETVVLGI